MIGFIVNLLSIIILANVHLYNCSCPEVCEPCIQGLLYCVNVGLTEIPTAVPAGLHKVTIQRQLFSSSELRSTNLSAFTGISELSIRSSNINKILPFTFSKLTSLKLLDLSDNAELIVKQMAFDKLNLNILKLDNMGLITLEVGAFSGLLVRSLSIQNSNLLTLPVKLIQPIAKSLLHLFLKNNHLRTLDPVLQPIFQNLETLELQKNPFICNCSILWLSKILQYSASVKTNSPETVLDSSDEQYPRCVSPAELRKKYVHTISGKLTKCSPPNIVRIDISFQSHSSAIIHCFTDNNKHSQYPDFIGWLPSHDSLVDITQLKQVLKVARNAGQQKYFCRAGNANGNSELAFQIDWLFSQPILNDSNSKPRISNNRNNISEPKSILWGNMFSLFEMICAILGTLIITVIVFLTFCCCHRCRLHIPFIEDERKFQYKVPLHIDGDLYNDHGRYYETDMDGHMFPPPPPTPPPFPTNRIML